MTKRLENFKDLDELKSYSMTNTVWLEHEGKFIKRIVLYVGKREIFYRDENDFEYTICIDRALKYWMKEAKEKVRYVCVDHLVGCFKWRSFLNPTMNEEYNNLKLTFDENSGKLIRAEVV